MLTLTFIQPTAVGVLLDSETTFDRYGEACYANISHSTLESFYLYISVEYKIIQLLRMKISYNNDTQ